MNNSIKMKTINDVKYRLLCNSIIKNEHCKYGHNCNYAHNIDEQIIDNFNLYTIGKILTECSLEDVLLVNNATAQLYRKLYSYTSICPKCIAHECTGGFNCKEGAPTKELLICYDDFCYGHCKNKEEKLEYSSDFNNKFAQLISTPIYIGCSKGHHLTKRFLLSYNIQCQLIDEKINDYASDNYSEEEELEILDSNNQTHKLMTLEDGTVTRVGHRYIIDDI